MNDTDFVTRGELAAIVQQLRNELREVVQLLERGLDTFEHKLNRMTVVFGTTLFLLLLVELLVLRSVGV
jgi:hypothetical protein